MRIRVQPFTVHKRFALTISRGTTAQSTNLWVTVIQDELEGWGEASPFAADQQPQTSERILADLQRAMPLLEQFSPLDQQAIEQVLRKAEIGSAARAALDVAMHDWLGKRVGLPLWQLWGLDCSRIVPTSVTIGINTPEAARARVRDWLDFAAPKTLKVKLGNPAGIEADRAMLLAIREEAPSQPISVDANGGWSLADAVKMCDWLAEQQVTYVEQPLAKGQEADLSELNQQSPLPLFVDESCWTSHDIVRLADRVQGINIKLMKCGGLTEARRMVHTAQACGLQIMFGCYSDSSLANTALAQLSPLADRLDLDSQLNLVDDPFAGATLQDGRVMPNDRPGLGVQRHAANA
ncbi:dipeptide epimerase [Leptolyngbya sp. FACHB-261]|uniref:dipeptide epimerase n=1 Tax=Leptolyngbya sp. FACHB-261 TaxID=2692806 RepID=UPI001689A6F3|nr:dipeptide epimerase [Leptolyngbya sp. FACHB-261]MBD2104705.1 dipeptide epimerase [Leptolyngbya sp. FACHB-261]